MLDDVDRALASFVQAAVDPAGVPGVHVAFDPPSTDLAAAATPKVDLFLYDVAENRDTKSADWVDERDATGNVVGTRPPVRRFDVSYLLSVWGGTTEQQHRLLGAVLAAMPAYDNLPAQHLGGELADSGLTVGLRVGTTDTASLWTSLGQPARASIALVVTAPVLPALLTDVAPPPRSIDLGLASTNGRPGRPPVPELPEPPGTAPLKHRPAAADGEQAAPRWTTFRVREHIAPPAEPG